jgi:hypothetical protein
MGGRDDVLLDELKTLRAGRGVNSSDFEQRLGPRLRAVCGVLATDPAAVVRQKVAAALGALAEQLPPDLAIAARAALALHPEARHPFLAQRITWLAGQLDRDARTARRRTDEALGQLAELAAAAAERTGATPADDAYYIEEFAALLRLDRPTPEALERRTVVANTDGLAELDALLTLPREPSDNGQHDLDVEVLYGVTMVGRGRDTDSRFRFGLRLAEPLHAGDRHEYGMLFRIPPKQRMRTHYVFTSHRRCDAFDLRIRFPLDAVPTDVRQLVRSYPRDVDDGAAGEPVGVDSAGDLHLRFTHLQVGLGYGVRWGAQPGAPS